MILRYINNNFVLWTQRKIKYFVLEASILGVKTSPSIENTEPENKMQLSSTNFQDRKYWVSETFGL